ncbi:MAG: leucine-rich repeat domain-containing protein [bacterium]
MKKLTILFCAVALIAGCKKKPTSDEKKKDDPMATAMDTMDAMDAMDTMDAMDGMDAMRPAATRPAAMAPAGKFVTISGVTPELEKVKCGWGRCDVGVITQAAKAEIEKQKDFQKVKVTFRKGSTSEHFKTVQNLPWLRKLDISYTMITDIAPVAALVELEDFTARSLKLEKKDKDEVPLDLTPLKGLGKLKELELYGTKVANAQVLAGHSKLEKLGFYMSYLTDVGFVKDLTNLVELDLYACRLTSIAAVAGLTKLTKLNLYMNKSTDFTPLKGLVNLEVLWLQFTKIKDLSVLAGMTKMKKLYLNWANEIEDLSPLKAMVNMEYFDVSSKKVKDLSVVANFKKMRTFSADGTQIKDIKFLKGHTELTSVSIRNTKVRDIRPLAGAVKLWSVQIQGTKVKNVAALKGAKRLYSLTVSKGFPKAQLKALQNKLPKLKVHER